MAIVSTIFAVLLAPIISLPVIVYYIIMGLKN